MEKLDHKQSRFPGLKFCLECQQSKGQSSEEHPFPKNAGDKAAFLSQRSLGLHKLSAGQAVTLWKAARYVRGTGSDSKTKLHKLATAAKNTWGSKGRRMLKAGKFHVFCLTCSLLLEQH